MTYTVSSGTLNSTIPYHTIPYKSDTKHGESRARPYPRAKGPVSILLFVVPVNSASHSYGQTTVTPRAWIYTYDLYGLYDASIHCVPTALMFYVRRTLPFSFSNTATSKGLFGDSK